jgi:hypothetical protein
MNAKSWLFPPPAQIIILPILIFMLNPPVEAYAWNVIRNSSFEIPTGFGWALKGELKLSAPLGQSHFDSRASYDGQSSLKLEYYDQINSQTVLSPIIRLKRHTRYTLSFYAKANYSTPEMNIKIKNSFDSPYGPGDVIGPRKIMVSSTWARYSMSFTTADSAKCSYIIYIWPAHQSIPNKFLWIDALQLEEGNMSSYHPRSSIEAGPCTDKTGNVFFDDENVSFSIWANNFLDTACTAGILYEVVDFWGKVPVSGRIVMDLPARGLAKRSLDIPLSASDKRGSFRLVTWVDGKDGTRSEKNFSVLYRPSPGPDPESIFGVHAPFKNFYFDVIGKIGAKWNRTLSTSRILRWSEIEPTNNAFIWKDSDVSRAGSWGIRVIGTLGEELSSVPAWAMSASGFPRMSDWSDYVYKVVSHYHDKISTWEVWNEPDSEGGLSSRPDIYGNILKRAYIAAKSADPTCTVVGMTAADPVWIQSVYSYIGTSFLDVMGTHVYPGNDANGERLMNLFGQPLSIPIWNTETGIPTKSFYQDIFWEDLWITTQGKVFQPDQGGDYRSRTMAVVRNFAASVGSGLDKYIYYDCRETTSPDFLITYSFFEWDQTLRPSAVAYSVLAYFFDHSKGQGPFTIDSGVDSYSFLRGTVPLAILWAKDYNAYKQLGISLSSSQVKLFNVMGNEIPYTSTLLLGNEPIILEGQGITLGQLEAGLSIAAGVDNTPPSVRLVTNPTGPTNPVNVNLRWLGVDDTTLTFHTTVELHEVVNYSFRLDGIDADWSPWGEGISTVYENLPYGDHVFRVRGKDIFGNISESSTSLRIKRPDPPTNLRIQ